MRKIYFAFLSCLIVAASACQNSDNAQEMLQNENERRQVYNTILEDEQMRNEMMALMRDKNMGAGMKHSGGMIGDTAGMARVHRQQTKMHMQQMMAMCEADTAACHEMSRMMLQNPGMMRHMKQRMQEQGMIDTTCMQEMKQRMSR